VLPGEFELLIAGTMCILRWLSKGSFERERRSAVEPLPGRGSELRIAEPFRTTVKKISKDHFDFDPL
jgi:hypothetical protein